jgi:hypothetical protein
MPESRLGPNRTTFTGTDPAANTEVSETIPSNEDWDFLGLVVTLVADATVANRDVDIVIEDASGNEVARWPSKTSITASQTVAIHVGQYPDTLPTDTTTDQYHALPQCPIELGPSYVVKTVTANLQTGDNFGAPVIFRRLYSA